MKSATVLAVVLFSLCGPAGAFELKTLSGRIIDLRADDAETARARAAFAACLDEYEDYTLNLVRNGLRSADPPATVARQMMVRCMVRYGYVYTP
jgi:hypothetical protein